MTRKWKRIKQIVAYGHMLDVRYEAFTLAASSKWRNVTPVAVCIYPSSKNRYVSFLCSLISTSQLDSQVAAFENCGGTKGFRLQLFNNSLDLWLKI